MFVNQKKQDICGYMGSEQYQQQQQQQQQQ